MRLFERQASLPIGIPTRKNSHSHEESIQEKGTTRQRRHTTGGFEHPDPGSPVDTPNLVGGINRRRKTLTHYFEEILIVAKNRYDAEITAPQTSEDKTSHPPVTLFYETAKPYRQTQYDTNAKLREATESTIEYLEAEIRTIENNLSRLRTEYRESKHNCLNIQESETQLRYFLEALLKEIRHKLKDTAPLRKQKDKSKSDELMLEKLKYCESRLKELRSKASLQSTTKTTRDPTPPTNQYEDDDIFDNNEYGLII